MTDVRLLKVLIASPGDLVHEREMLTRALGEWNAQNAEEYRLVFLPVMWEQHAYAELAPNQGVQDILNTQIGTTCDMVVGMFWGRLGTPTEKYPSGTVEEIENFLAAGKPVMLYFSNATARL